MRSARGLHMRSGARWALLLLTLCVLCLVPQSAFAKSYSMPEVDIQASVEPDGSLEVVERRTFDFDGSFTAVWWDFDKIYQPKVLVPNGVEVAFGGGEDVQSQNLPEVAFQKPWRTEGGPGQLAYSHDDYYDAIYVFFDAADTTMVATLSYTIEHAVDVHTDCAELYWQYLGVDWAEDSRNVTCTIALPADGQTGVVGETVRAWGHGPLTGKVAFDDSATQVTYTVNRVRSGEFAEARVVFPTDWLSVAEGYEDDPTPALSHILYEEEQWASEANRGRIASLAFLGVLTVVALGSVVWALRRFLQYGREYQPNFTDKYWRDVPNADVHPAVIGRLMNWNDESSDEVVATILHLANKGIISIGRGVRPSGEGTPAVDGGTPAASGASADGVETDAGRATDQKQADAGRATDQKQADQGYYITLREGGLGFLDDDIDTGLVNFLFGDIAKNGDTLWLDDIAAWGDAHKKSFNNKLEKWHKVVSKQVKKVDYFEKKGEEVQENIQVLAFVLGGIGLYAWTEVGNLMPLLFFAPAAVVVLVLAFFMPRRTRKGAEDYARAKALKRWLEDFTLLDERIPTDVKVWGEFMVYAQLFGVADKVVSQLRGAVPEMFAQPAGTSGGGLAWHAWYAGSGTTRSGAGSFASSFDTMWANTASTAAAAASAASKGSGGFSSGGGFGGGFSGGGGGGFGGGGGGAR